MQLELEAPDSSWYVPFRHGIHFAFEWFEAFWKCPAEQFVQTPLVAFVPESHPLVTHDARVSAAGTLESGQTLLHVVRPVWSL